MGIGDRSAVDGVASRGDVCELAGHDGNGLAEEANPLPLRANPHDAAAGGGLVAGHFLLAELARPIGAEAAVSRAGDGILIYAEQRREVSRNKVIRRRRFGPTTAG